MKESLVSSDAVLCPRLQETVETSGVTKRGIEQIAVHALVQHFEDGVTRVLCGELSEGKCSKSEDDPCTFIASPKQE